MHTINLIIKPDEDDPEAAEVLVDGAVAGRPTRFLLDTGAARTSLRFDDYTAGFPSTEQNHSSGVFARHSDDLITVPRVEVGPLSWENVALVRMAQERHNVRNLIGMDLLKAFACHFRFDQNRVILAGPPAGAPLRRCCSTTNSTLTSTSTLER